MEADLRDIGWDLRDWFRPHGGAKGLTTRVLLQIVVLNLCHKSSRFWMAVTGNEDRVTPTQQLLADLFHAYTGHQHPLTHEKELRRKQREREALRDRILANEKRWRASLKKQH